MDRDHTTCTAFTGDRFLASGPAWQVALAVKAVLSADAAARLLIFDDSTGRQVDFDLRGSDAEIVARLKPADPGSMQADTARAPGRPKLGVVAREVTLLPRHWDWLASQPGGASVTLRKLVEAARAAGHGTERVRTAQQAADRFMAAMLGNAAGYEDASRALYAGDAARFQELSAGWPADLRDYARRLAAPAFADAAA
jgi:hypothetical protein